MPLYIAEYLADTGHLTTTQHGAYLLLIMHYWRKRELPNDDKQLAAIAKLPLRLWLDMKETIQAFFSDGWLHHRIEDELGKRQVLQQKRANAGSIGGMRTQMNHALRAANAQICLRQEHKPSKSSSTVSVERGLGKGDLTLSPAALAGISGRKN
jgi:uncharacterized protein YdaU (DUF1376 family)